MLSDAGVIYVVRGEEYIQQACRSATSLKETSPGVSITLFTPDPVDCPAIDEVRPIEDGSNYRWEEKIHTVLNTPYERTLVSVNE